MTDEERRQKLVANLYSVSRDDDRAALCYDAADEIELLMGEVKNWELWARSQPIYQEQLDALDRPLGFRTNDVPHPYAEGPSDDD